VSSQRRRVLESFGSAPATLEDALRRFPRKMWLYMPSPDRPSIHDTVWYLADSEATEYISCRSLIADPDSSPPNHNSAAWSRGLGYFYQDVKAALDIIRTLRRVTYILLKTLPEAAWTVSADFPMQGRLSLDEWLAMRESHFPDYIERMERIHADWMQAVSSRKNMLTRSVSPIENFAPRI
jgi:hypothetical protein